jgi:hypothetical protein
MVTLFDPDHENFDVFLGYVLDDYTAGVDPGPRDSNEHLEHAAALHWQAG